MSFRSSSGLRAWIVQRCSAVYLAMFFIYSGILFLQTEAFSYSQWKAWVTHPFNNIAIALFFLALILHAWIGSRDIIMDYIKPAGFRLIKLSGVALFLMAMAVWSLKVLFVTTN